MANKSLPEFKMEEKILLASYILIALAYGTMFYLKWKSHQKQGK
jgi:hypothetical protein